MNLPNTLTLGRIFLVPLLVVVLITEFEGLQVLGAPKEYLAAASSCSRRSPTGSTATSRGAASRSRRWAS